MPNRKVDLTGRVFGRLLVLHEAPKRPAPPGRGRTYWTCLCECGAVTEVAMGCLRRGTTRSCGCLARDVAREAGKARTGELNHSWTGGFVTYAGIHQRLRIQRGAASKQSCVDCGWPAKHWAYAHDCPDERTDEALGLAYCPHLEHFDPRCVPCHSAFDQGLPPRSETLATLDAKVFDISSGGENTTGMGARAELKENSGAEDGGRVGVRQVL